MSSPSPSAAATPRSTASPSAGASATPSASPRASATASAKASPSPSPEQFLLYVGTKGDDVLKLQLRLNDLGYFMYRATGAYGSMTFNAVAAFQKANGLSIDGQAGEATYDLVFSKNAARPIIKKAAASDSGDPQNTGERLEWSAVRSLLKPGKSIQIEDVYSDATFTMECTLDTAGHADVECASEKDFDAFKSLFSDGVSWDKRPVVVVVDNKRIAASLFGMPHGEDTVEKNVMTGHACLYFEGSTQDNWGFTDAQHAANIAIACGED